MKKFAKLIVSLMLITVLCAPLLNCFVSAATTSTIAFSKNQLTVGDEFTVTVRINADEEMQSVQYNINYDASVLQYVGGDDCNGGAGTVIVAFGGGGQKTATKKCTFKAIGVGSTRIATADAVYVNKNLSKVAVPAQGGTVAIKAKATNTSSTASTSSNTSSNSSTTASKQPSGDATLKSLSVSDGDLSPKFSPSKTSYSVVVPNSVTEITVYATAKADGAKVKLKGDGVSSSKATLKIGKNQITVTVTAPDGTIKNYTINVTRSETEEVPSVPEDTTSTDTPTSTDPLTPVIDGVKYTIATDLTDIALINGFTATKVNLGGTEVAVAVDADKVFKIFYLKAEDGSDYIPYTYNESKEVFEKLVYLIQKETVYFICNLPEGYTVPDEYYSTTTIIAKTNIKCFSNVNSEMNDFYYLYCFANGRYGFYRYDSREVVLQRYPELKLVADNKIDTDVKPLPDNSFMGRFNTLTTNAKIIVIGLVVVIVFAAVLGILLIVKLVRKNEYDDLEDSDAYDEFDNVSVMSNFSIMNEESDDSTDMEEEIDEEE